jgi:PTS system mannose-specific IIA component
LRCAGPGRLAQALGLDGRHDGADPTAAPFELVPPVGRVEVVAGLNLPMLVKLARIRKDCPLDKAATAAQDAGRKYINVASQILGD